VFGGEGGSARAGGGPKMSSTSSSRTASSSVLGERDRQSRGGGGGVENGGHTHRERGYAWSHGASGSNSDDDAGVRGGGGEQVEAEGNGRHWVQVRAPFRIEARILDLTSSPLEGNGAGARLAQAMTPSSTEVLDEDGMPLFSVMADFGRVAVTPGASEREQHLGMNPPSEPPSTGIEMTPVDDSGKRRPIKTFSGSLAR